MSRFATPISRESPLFVAPANVLSLAGPGLVEQPASIVNAKPAVNTDTGNSSILNFIDFLLQVNKIEKT
jgi:hypothetical protein